MNYLQGDSWKVTCFFFCGWLSFILTHFPSLEFFLLQMVRNMIIHVIYLPLLWIWRATTYLCLLLSFSFSFLFFSPFFLFYENVLHYVQLTVKIWPFSSVKVFDIFVESSKASLVYFKTSSQRNYGGWPNALHYPWALSLPLWATSLVIQIIDDWSG